MRTEWKEEYESLAKYAADHPEIVVGKTEVSIARELRDEFYRRLEQLRLAFVEEHYSSLPADVESLSRHYVAGEKEITERLGLDRIEMPMDLYSLVHQPKEGMMRVLYNRTFDLVQGKTTVDAFEAQAAGDLNAMAGELFRLGYEHWAALTLIKLLEPDEAYRVDLDEDYKPCLGELKSIAFGRQAHHPTIRIPEFVLHSRRLSRYVAVKMVLANEIESLVPQYRPPVRPKKKTGDTSLALDSRVMLLSFMESAKDIPVIAEIYDLKLTNPDWMMECISGRELRQPGAIDPVMRHLEALRPKRGTCLVLADGETDSLPAGIPENLRPVSAGFDEARLRAVVDSLV